jgi:hypothetical protein
MWPLVHATARLTCALKANSNVATSSSHGINFEKAAFEVASSSSPPHSPPTSDTTPRIAAQRP